MDKNLRKISLNDTTRKQNLNAINNKNNEYFIEYVLVDYDKYVEFLFYSFRNVNSLLKQYLEYQDKNRNLENVRLENSELNFELQRLETNQDIYQIIIQYLNKYEHDIDDLDKFYSDIKKCRDLMEKLIDLESDEMEYSFFENLYNIKDKNILVEIVHDAKQLFNDYLMQIQQDINDIEDSYRIVTGEWVDSTEILECYKALQQFSHLLSDFEFYSHSPDSLNFVNQEELNIQLMQLKESFANLNSIFKDCSVSDFFKNLKDVDFDMIQLLLEQEIIKIVDTNHEVTASKDMKVVEFNRFTEILQEDIGHVFVGGLQELSLFNDIRISHKLSRYAEILENMKNNSYIQNNISVPFYELQGERNSKKMQEADVNMSLADIDFIFSLSHSANFNKFCQEFSISLNSVKRNLSGQFVSVFALDEKFKELVMNYYNNNETVTVNDLYKEIQSSLLKDNIFYKSLPKSKNPVDEYFTVILNHITDDLKSLDKENLEQAFDTCINNLVGSKIFDSKYVFGIGSTFSSISDTEQIFQSFNVDNEILNNIFSKFNSRFTLNGSEISLFIDEYFQSKRNENIYANVNNCKEYFSSDREYSYSDFKDFLNYFTSNNYHSSIDSKLLEDLQKDFITIACNKQPNLIKEIFSDISELCFDVVAENTKAYVKHYNNVQPCIFYQTVHEKSKKIGNNNFESLFGNFVNRDDVLEILRHGIDYVGLQNGIAFSHSFLHEIDSFDKALQCLRFLQKVNSIDININISDSMFADTIGMSDKILNNHPALFYMSDNDNEKIFMDYKLEFNENPYSYYLNNNYDNDEVREEISQLIEQLISITDYHKELEERNTYRYKNSFVYNYNHRVSNVFSFIQMYDEDSYIRFLKTLQGINQSYDKLKDNNEEFDKSLKEFSKQIGKTLADNNSSMYISWYDLKDFIINNHENLDVQIMQELKCIEIKKECGQLLSNIDNFIFQSKKMSIYNNVEVNYYFMSEQNEQELTLLLNKLCKDLKVPNKKEIVKDVLEKIHEYDAIEMWDVNTIFVEDISQYLIKTLNITDIQNENFQQVVNYLEKMASDEEVLGKEKIIDIEIFFEKLEEKNFDVFNLIQRQLNSFVNKIEDDDAKKFILNIIDDPNLLLEKDTKKSFEELLTKFIHPKSMSQLVSFIDDCVHSLECCKYLCEGFEKYTLSEQYLSQDKFNDILIETKERLIQDKCSGILDINGFKLHELYASFLNEYRTNPVSYDLDFVHILLKTQDFVPQGKNNSQERLYADCLKTLCKTIENNSSQESIESFKKANSLSGEKNCITLESESNVSHKNINISARKFVFRNGITIDSTKTNSLLSKKNTFEILKVVDKNVRECFNVQAILGKLQENDNFLLFFNDTNTTRVITENNETKEIKRPYAFNFAKLDNEIGIVLTNCVGKPVFFSADVLYRILEESNIDKSLDVKTILDIDTINTIRFNISQQESPQQESPQQEQPFQKQPIQGQPQQELPQQELPSQEQSQQEQSKRKLPTQEQEKDLSQQLAEQYVEEPSEVPTVDTSAYETKPSDVGDLSGLDNAEDNTSAILSNPFPTGPSIKVDEEQKAFNDGNIAIKTGEFATEDVPNATDVNTEKAQEQNKGYKDKKIEKDDLIRK